MRVSRWDAVVENRLNDDENFALPDPVCLRLALSTSGSGEGFLLPKNMTLKTVDGELNTQDFSISITNQSDQPISFVFYDVAEVDWLIGQLKGIRSNIQATDREIRKRVTFLKCSSRVDPVERDYTQMTKEEATLRFAELRKSISEI